MKSRLLTAGVAILGFAIIDGKAANADKYFNPPTVGSTANWDDAVWNSTDCDTEGQEGPPSSSDPATICFGHRAVVDDDADVAREVTVEDTAKINIYPDPAVATLTLGDGAADRTSTLVGDIYLLKDPEGVEGQIARLTFDRTYDATAGRVFDHTFTGTGSIIGQHDLAEILIPDDSSSQGKLVMMTIDHADVLGQVRVEGNMRFTGPGDFLNDGLVIANVTGTLDFTLTGSIADMCPAGGCARWQVSMVSGAMLRFLEKPDCLAGDFIVSKGTLRAGDDVGGDDIDVLTTGDLLHTGGLIIAGENDSFTFNGACP